MSDVLIRAESEVDLNWAARQETRFDGEDAIMLELHHEHFTIDQR